MDVFEFRGRLVTEYSDFTRSFTRIKADDIRAFVDAEYDSQKFWPEPLIQVNPNFKEGSTVEGFVEAGHLHPLCADIFRFGKSASSAGHSLPLHKHQVEAISLAASGESYVLTTGKTPELERYNAIALYCVFAELQRAYVVADIKADLRAWFLDFETRRRVQDALDEDQAEPEWVSYKERISHSTDAQDSIRFRMDFMMRDLLTRFPTLALKDNQRDFTYIQKLTIFRRDHQLCQVRLKCQGEKVVWDAWNCDHKLAWSKGGPTTVENGQVACPSCNLAKGAD